MGSYQNKKASGPATDAQIAKAIKLNADGVKFQLIMDQTGLSMAQADRAIYSDRAKNRLDSLKVTKISDAALFWLGAPSVDREHDVVFKAVAELVRDADLTQSECKALTDSVATARSDESAVSLVVAERESMDARIAAVKAGTFTKSIVKKSLSEQVIASVAKLSDEDRAAMLAALTAETPVEEPVTA